MFSWARALRANGILGLNERNAQVIQRFNLRKLYPLVDDKLRTKRLALEAGISVPELYGAIKSQHDVRSWSKVADQHADFVIKPAHGTGGDGILVVTGRSSRRQRLYQLIDGSVISEAGISHHVSNIISGQYSFVGTRDCAMIEYRVETDPFFAAVTFQGVPDVRILVYQGYPVMASGDTPFARQGEPAPGGRRRRHRSGERAHFVRGAGQRYRHRAPRYRGTDCRTRYPFVGAISVIGRSLL